MSTRLVKLRSQFEALGLDAFLVTYAPHLRYLSGFSGSNGLGLITRRSSVLITDGRYEEQVKSEVKGWKVIISQLALFDELRDRGLLRPGVRVGFDGNSLLYTQFKDLKRAIPTAKFLPKVDCIEQIAIIKEQSEIDAIRKAVGITDRVFEEILELIRPGMSELDVAAEISYRQRKHGAERDAFETIVASGERGALPHGRASAKKLRRGELVTLDFGCVVDGYHSDMTRTIALGKPGADEKKIYNVVYTAQQKAVDKARSGLAAKSLDAVARDHIKEKGFDKFYRHSLGHGIGLQIHEPPRISVLSKAVLASGNVITVEPGIYVPRIGGVRIEDDVVITSGSCEVLNRSPKDLIII